MNEIIVDCTELYYRPVTTGIQRVARELLRYWPDDGPNLHAARHDPVNGLVRLPRGAVDLLIQSEPGTRALPLEEVQRRLGAFAHHAVGPPLPSAAPVLIPEIFYDPVRCRFHEERLAAYPGSLAMLAFDFLPYLQPSIFSFTSASPLMVYLRLISLASSVAFISVQTRQDFASRVLRVPPDDPRIGPVLSLGADGVPVERQVWRDDRRQFVCLGSLEERKNQRVVAAAFMQLWEAGHDLPLVLIGRKFHQQRLDWLDRALTFPQFRWLNAALDDDVAAALRTARATIFLSTAEGFGLPPIESLKAGVPVITLRDVPSVAMLPPLGQIRLPDLSVEAVANAVLALEDDRVAERLWAEAATLDLGTWRTFAVQVAEWCAGLAATTSNVVKGHPRCKGLPATALHAP